MLIKQENHWVLSNDESYLVLVLGRFASHFSKHTCAPCGSILLNFYLRTSKPLSVGEFALIFVCLCYIYIFQIFIVFKIFFSFFFI